MVPGSSLQQPYYTEMKKTKHEIKPFILAPNKDARKIYYVYSTYAPQLFILDMNSIFGMFMESLCKRCEVKKN